MTCVTLAMFLTALGQTTVATALPSIVADLGGFDRYVWVATAYVAPTFLALSVGGVQYAWSSPQCLGLLTFGWAMAAAFVFIESRARSPIMSLELYANLPMASAMLVVLLTGFVMYGALIFLPLFFQGVLGASATDSSKLLVPILSGLIIGAIVSGQLLSRTGGHYRTQVLATTLLTAVGMYLISTMDEATGVVLMETYIVLTGLGMGARWPCSRRRFRTGRRSGWWAPARRPTSSGEPRAG